MNDRIFIRDLRVRTIIGIHEEERRHPQDVLINIALDTDARAAGASDDIADTVNYSTLAKRLVAFAERSRFELVEKLAAEIAAICLEEPRVIGVRVCVEKPTAVQNARGVGVEIYRTRAD